MSAPSDKLGTPQKQLRYNAGPKQRRLLASMQAYAAGLAFWSGLPMELKRRLVESAQALGTRRAPVENRDAFRLELIGCTCERRFMPPDGGLFPVFQKGQGSGFLGDGSSRLIPAVSAVRRGNGVSPSLQTTLMRDTRF